MIKTGIGYDVHKLALDSKLILGGVEIPSETESFLNEKDKILRILNTSITFMIIASLIIITFQSSLWNLYSYVYDQNPIIENLTKDYYSISILGIAPQLIIVSSTSWFLGIKKPKKI